MGTKDYRFLYEGGEGEIEVKKSRFIAALAPVSSEEEALSFIAEKKKQYWDARHNCHAFIVGDNPGVLRFSDDGEPGGTAGKPMLEVLTHEGLHDVKDVFDEMPGGTAGKPMLEVLTHEGLHDVCAVVTRYFGGVLLGTGGLVRAYQGAVQAALPSCRFGTRFEGVAIGAVLPYTDLGKVENRLRELPSVHVADTKYGENVTLSLVSPTEEKDGLMRVLMDITSGRAVLSCDDPKFFDEVDGKILSFS